MRKVLVIALNHLVRTARDKKALIMLLLMPMVLISILGSALGDILSGGKINPFAVVVVNADQTTKVIPPKTPESAISQLPEFNFGKLLVDDILTSDMAKSVMKLATASDVEAVKQAVADGKYVAAIYVSPTFTADALNGRKPSIRVFGDPTKPTSVEIVNQIVGSFTEGVTSGILANQLAGPEQAQKLTSTVGAKAQSTLATVKEVASGANNISAIQYYSAAMAAMFMVMTAFGQAKSIIEDRKNGTLTRILVSPTSKGIALAGQMLGTVLLILAQFLVLMLGTHFLYGVYWGPWIPAIMLGLAFSLAASGIGTAAAAFLNDPRAADAGIGLIGNLFAALSGSMFPLYGFPDAMKLVAKFVPNYWALQGFLDQMAGNGLNHLWLPVSVLALIGLGTGAIGTARMASR